MVIEAHLAHQHLAMPEDEGAEAWQRRGRERQDASWQTMRQWEPCRPH